MSDVQTPSAANATATATPAALTPPGAAAALTPARVLPADAARAVLIGRLWVPGSGPVLVTVHGERLLDISTLAPTCAELLERPDAAAAVRALREAHDSLPLEPARATWPLATVLAASDGNARPDADAGAVRLLAPCDLQVVKASGVTFVASLLERVIEEQARGDAARAVGIRQALAGILGDNLADIVPGSPQAAEVKRVLIERGAWSQYLEVGIGPDAEIFTKAPVLAAVGCGARVGILESSAWNNPEPEVVLAVASDGRIVGASLGNDVNLRDVEGRSALLLGKAKDNNASCAIGPFIRLFDDAFTLDTVRGLELSMQVEGLDGHQLQGHSSMARISRDPADLAAQAIGAHHQYPDGLMLFLGTMFAPTQDRHGPGRGFTHEVGDVVTVATPALGALVNTVDHCHRITPWTYGLRELMRDLAARGLLGAA
ncbi:fumarylacetoacetate hydrolase family protein [Pseudaquabacterium rugosum]|uniref:Fumarylacetoacetate hydrolase family protein n=1 Tax=Pseudaquabacterium rugosum TaxID=2984194 RepID=A0ABU9BAG4_9BURK